MAITMSNHSTSDPPRRKGADNALLRELNGRLGGSPVTAEQAQRAQCAGHRWLAGRRRMRPTATPARSAASRCCARS